ncbi:aspartyl/asparaginyl beta-hydroxylase domain-containing protein [Streptomyces sp. NPDC051014]|uniref:aspartyl/asparaginyl beta-hydroxylase domain-containing protein n=1 Tax=Streptomyces sp. NPDC051014 TaxID=3155751 RepID=UPI0033FC297F
MRTQLIGRIEFDKEKLAQDLERSFHITFAEPFDEFICGRPWKSAMLMTPGGGHGTALTQFDSSVPADVTGEGAKLPYVQEIIRKHFVAEHITFARLVVLNDSVFVPHCDYIDLSDDTSRSRIAHRVHIVLATGEDAMFNESDTIFRMREGEVWFLDAAKPHSAGVVGETRRVHLLIDMADVPDLEDLFTFDAELSRTIPPSNLCARPRLSEAEREGLHGLSRVIDEENFTQVLGLVIRKHYRRDGGPDFVWSTMREIARLSENDRIVGRVTDLFSHTNLQRREASRTS